MDVGGEYNPSTHRYDHHQRGFTETFSPSHSTKLSSAGLVYKHFGREVIASLLGLQYPIEGETEEKVKEKKVVDTVYAKVYDDFIEGFDGIDNGISQYPAELKPKYKESTNISARVMRLNPWWNQTGVDLDERFLKAGMYSHSLNEGLIVH